MKPDPDLITRAVAGWFGSARMVAADVGRALDGCEHVTIPFCGGMSEVPYIGARSIVCNDRHRHVMNCAEIIASKTYGPQLYRRVRRKPLHPDELKRAQIRCLMAERTMNDQDNSALFAQGYETPSPLEWAEAYFVCCWMGRGGAAGTLGEFRGGISVRYEAGGGDSAARYRSAVKSLIAWRRTLARCTFSTDDAFDVIARTKDQKGHGLYCDSPWVGAGDGYTHRFTLDHHRKMAAMLSAFKLTRVVIRHSVHPLYEELYPRDRWNWTIRQGRDQANQNKAEALIVSRIAA